MDKAIRGERRSQQGATVKHPGASTRRCFEALGGIDLGGDVLKVEPHESCGNWKGK